MDKVRITCLPDGSTVITINQYGNQEAILSQQLEAAKQNIADLQAAITTEKEERQAIADARAADSAAATADHEASMARIDALQAQITELQEQITEGATPEELADLTSQLQGLEDELAAIQSGDTASTETPQQ